MIMKWAPSCEVADFPLEKELLVTGRCGQSRAPGTGTLQKLRKGTVHQFLCINERILALRATNELKRFQGGDRVEEKSHLDVGSFEMDNSWWR